jgi:hypothetical protein
MACLLRASSEDADYSDKTFILQKYNIRGALLNNLPQWMVNWVIEVLFVLEDEISTKAEEAD